MAGSDDEIIPPPPPPQTQTPTQQGPHIVSTIKLPILKKGEYDILAMKMEHYLAHTDYPIWEVIQIGNGPSPSDQLEIHGVGVSTEDANQKYEPDDKGSTASSSSPQNGAFGISSSYTDELMYSFFANQSFGLQMDQEDLEQLMSLIRRNGFKMASGHDLHETENSTKKTGRKLQFDAKELVCFDKAKSSATIVHKTGHFARECRSKGNQDSRRRDAGYTGYKAKDSGRKPGKQEEPKALVTLNGEGVDWTSHSEDEQENYALMALQQFRLRH
ncbi:hypothetical protein Tco_0860433 [Tanacetum coccineum]|uniref:Uncharacterized protein n=1 Tax=Tanacetum coccineum TaxID=301880 RepID=A0ABQ5BFH0_9ASTR